MGEPSERSSPGALGLDAPTSTLDTRRGVADLFDLDGLGAGYILATLHPETRAPDATRPMAVARSRRSAGRTASSNHLSQRRSRGQRHRRCDRGRGRRPRSHPVCSWVWCRLVPTAMHRPILVGNSSGGTEAASFGLPVVNIGDRHADETTDPTSSTARIASILAAVHQAKTESFRADAAQGNIYGDGRGAERAMQLCGRWTSPSWRSPRCSPPRPDLRRGIAGIVKKLITLRGDDRDRLTLQPTEGLRHAMQRMNETGRTLLLVVDDERLRGVVADGDIRRFLAGEFGGRPAAAALNKNPTTAASIPLTDVRAFMARRGLVSHSWTRVVRSRILDRHPAPRICRR